jgi:serine protease Do
MTMRSARFGTRWARHAAGVVVCSLLAAGASAQGERFELAQTPATRPAAPARTRALPDFVALVKGEGAAVVNVSTTRAVRPTVGDVPRALLGEDLFSELLRRFLLGPYPRERETRTLGSGFIISDDGYVLTNSHLVADSDEVLVRLTDKRQFRAKVVGADLQTDVALLKIDATGLPKVRIGDPAALEVGEWVAAIGSPFGFEHSVTAGIVSAKGRFLPDEVLVGFIQTDVAINPGNSGGPLFNLAGEVVGINSLIYSESGGYMGLSFAIPIDIAMKVGDALRTRGRVSRGRLGVRVQELTPALAESFGLASADGTLVTTVEPDGAAGRAGVQPGDVIVGFAGNPVRNSAELLRSIAATEPGARVRIDVVRKGQQLALQATVSESAAGVPPRASAGAPRAGLDVTELSGDEKMLLEPGRGLMVRGVDSNALRAGIRPGDLILAVNDVAVNDVASFDRLLAQHAGRTVALRVRRGGEILYVPLRVPG